MNSREPCKEVYEIQARLSSFQFLYAFVVSDELWIVSSGFGTVMLIDELKTYNECPADIFEL